jgi:hypothetical protein
MTRFSRRDLLGRLPVTGPGELPCLNRHPWTGYGCQAVRGHPGPCRYYSERGWHVEWYPDRGEGESRGDSGGGRDDAG